MRSIASVIILFFALVVFVSLLIAAYYLIYKKLINKGLNDPNNTKKNIPSLPSFILAAILTVIIIYGIIISVSAIISRNEENRVEPPICSYTEIDLDKEDNEKKYSEIYSISENTGYDKYEEKINDIRFTYFISESEYDTYHPSFIVFAEYTGNEEILHRGVNGTFYYIDNSLIGGYGYAGGDGTNILCFIGDASYECIFELEVAFYNTHTKSEDFTEGAAAVETLRFVVD